MSTLVSIAVPTPLRRRFDYLWPAHLGTPQAGQRVLVPFGNRRLVAVVLTTVEHSDVPTAQLKPVLSLLDEQAPTLSAELLGLGCWAADYYHHPIGECLQQMLPVALRKATPPKEAPSRNWQLSDNWQALPPLSTRAHQQRALVELMQQHGQLSRRQLRDLGYSGSVITALISAGYIVAAPPPAPTTTAPSPGLALNGEQDRAVTEITQALGSFQRFLLDGVTGSGKTEVYLQAIAHCLTRGEQALVLVPEIGLTPQTLQRFEQRFPGQVIALHSGLGDAERFHNWRAAGQQRRAIVLGTRSAVFSDFAKLGLIIVDEEHDASYKQQDGWRYSARDIAVKRAANWQCPVVLASATPSLDSLHNQQQGRYRPLALHQRAGGASAPQLQLLDIRRQPLEEGLSPLLLSRIDDCLQAGNQALIFLNRRGFAPLLQCHSCGWMADCQACDARMTVHFKRRELRCHHCDARQPLPQHCPQCHNAELYFQGPGTERLEMALNRRFPQAPITRIDRDTTSNKGSMQGLVTRIQRGEPGILVGTQMLAKGHHFPDVTLVGIVDIDGGLFSPDFRAAERCGQLLMQVSGRAGRAEKTGQVLIQSHCPDHPVLLELIDGGYGRFAQRLLAERRLLDLPPYTHMAVLRADATSLAQAEAFLQGLRSAIEASAPPCSIVGPLPAPMARRAGRYRCSLLLQAGQRRNLHQALALACRQGESQRRLKALRWSVDVDPIELF